MTAPIDAVSGLVEELRALADYDSRAGEPLGKCMRRAADALEAQARELAAKEDEINGLLVRHEGDLAFCSQEILEARARIAALEDAVRPLAAMDAKTETGHAFGPWADDAVVFDIGKDRKITAGDLRRARTALSKGQNALVSGREDGE